MLKKQHTFRHRSSISNWLNNISISKKLYFVLGTMAFLIVMELCTLWFAINTLSSVRAYVGGEGLWSKAEKDAVFYLRNYSYTRDEADYLKFRSFLKVNLGDRQARLELNKEKPDMQIVREGFLAGRNHPDDINGMSKLFRRFYWVYYINQAITIWGRADLYVLQLEQSAEKLHNEIQSGKASPEGLKIRINEIEALNEKVTIEEDAFSYILGEGSRWMENLVLKILFIIALTVELTGIFLTVSVSMGISKGINETMRIVKKVSEGNFDERAEIYSRDEIGQLALSFNKMTDDLEKKIFEVTEAERKISESRAELEVYSKQLEHKNTELERFSYIVSHDLKAPLRAIGSLSNWLLSDTGNKLTEDGKASLQLLDSRVKRMYGLIEGILAYAKAGHTNNMLETVDANKIVNDVIENIDKYNTSIIIEGTLPVIKYEKLLLTQVFQNLIGNAVNHMENPAGLVTISCRQSASDWVFTVADNGVGIAEKYYGRVFEIFQTLKPRDEFESTGVGLSIVKKIVTAKGGSIWIEPNEGKGAKFIFTVPV